MRVLVTGSQGCIGAWVVRSLLARGLDVITYDADPDPTRLALITSPEVAVRVPMELGRIEDTARIKALVRTRDITHIVHLAAVLMPYCQANPVEGGIVNIIGTLNVFEAARDAGRDVRVVYASSSAVWGPEDAYGSGMLTEDDPLKPGTHYGVFKQANEGNARAFYAVNGISSVGLRPWTVYGPGRDRGLTADPTLAMRALAFGEPFQIRVSGYMDLQYVEDVAETFVRCLLAPVQGAYVFNLQGSVIGMQELIETFDKIRPGANNLITFAGPQVPVAYRMDDSELRSKIPGIPRTPLEAGVQKTIEHFESLRARQETGVSSGER
jgi:UDP-glucose 4-epimerase